MADGFIKSGAVKPADISVANPTAKKLEHFALQGASVTTDNKTAADGADIVIIAVKPWLVEQVVNELKPAVVKHRGGNAYATRDPAQNP